MIDSEQVERTQMQQRFKSAVPKTTQVGRCTSSRVFISSIFFMRFLAASTGRSSPLCDTAKLFLTGVDARERLC